MISLLTAALEARSPLLDERHEAALRLFNGFTEGEPDLVVDLYASTLVIHNYAGEAGQGRPLVEQAAAFLQDRLPWLRAGIVKSRNSPAQVERRGQLLFGSTPDNRIREHGVWYAVDLMLNRDAGFYLDTRVLRKWLIEHMQGKTVLNTFAYTGSLGVAALAGGAARVVQHDRNPRFLEIARMSSTLNGFSIGPPDFVAEDFFTVIARLKRTGETFDCVIIDPPFFSTTSRGMVDQINASQRLINKVRPLVRDGGILIAINNALYLSGRDYLKALQDLCRDGYLTIQQLIPVPEDFIGYERVRQPVTDPAPFNHSTKMAILGVKRKPKPAVRA